MAKSLGGIDTVTAGILKFRWLVMGVVGFVVIVIDFVELYDKREFHFSTALLFEILLEGILLPFMGAFLLEVILKLLTDRFFILNYLQLKNELGKLVNGTPQLEELIKGLASFPSKVAPVIGTDLLVYEMLLDPLETRALWNHADSSIKNQPRWILGEKCKCCTISQSFSGPALCNCAENDILPIRAVRYCLPLQYANIMVAIFHLYFPPGSPITEDQKRYFRALAPEMAMAIDAARNRSLNHQLKQKIEAEHRQIVRELHDNMAHNLIYVRNQLDLLASGKEKKPISYIRTNLEKLHDTVDDVYMDLRSTLKNLEANPWTELSDDLQEFINTIQRQVSYPIHLSIQGTPQPFSTQHALQILFILKEILVNIEKHASASRVEVGVGWLHDGIHFAVKDDGIGFDPNADSEDGHMGMKIIKERAAELHGELEVKSTRGAGTEVSMWLPFFVNQISTT